MRKFLIYGIFIIINGIVGKNFYLATGENVNAKTVEKFGTAQHRLKELKKDGKGIVSAFVKTDFLSLTYRINEMPEGIDVLNVAFRGYPEECSDVPCDNPRDVTTCRTVLCGNVFGLFDYRALFGKKEWLEDIQKLRERHNNIIILFELSDEALYLKDYPEAFDHIDDVVNFLDEYDFDGVNIRLFAEKLHQKIDRLDKIIKFYNDYAVKIKDKIGDNRLLSFSFNSIGAFSNIGNSPHAKLLTSDDSAYSPTEINDTLKDDDFKKFATEDLAGLALPIVNTLKEKISIIFIVDQYEVITREQQDLFFHVLYSYLEFSDNYNITIQFGLDLNNVTFAVTLKDTDFIDDIIDEMSKENKENLVGCGIVFTHLGVPAGVFPGYERIPNIKKKLQ